MRRPVIEWPHGKKICATLTVAFEAFTRGGHFKKTKPGEVNLVSISHANYGGNAGIWRIDRKSTRLNSSHVALSRMPSSA